MSKNPAPEQAPKAERPIFAFAPEPPTELGRYRILSSTAGVKVSPLALGGMSIGGSWSKNMGAMDKEASWKLLDAYWEAGGNFIDTANNYQHEDSELFIGEWMKERGIRDRVFVATKYTAPYKTYEYGSGQALSYGGNHKKSLRLSVHDSLQKLQTDYIDLLYVHYWEYTTSIEEIMDSLHILVEQGKVLYLGISDTPAWVVSAANTYARAHGKTPFSVYQGKWNVIFRDFERDIIPMANHFGMALAPWGVLGQGKFQTQKQLEERKELGESLRSVHGPPVQSEEDKAISEALAKVAEEQGVEDIQTIALAYVLQKARNVFPIVGGRKVEQLHGNIKALSIHLTDDQIKSLESVKPFDPGFPVSMIGQDPRETDTPSVWTKIGGQLALIRAPKPIGHA